MESLEYYLLLFAIIALGVLMPQGAKDRKQYIVIMAVLHSLLSGLRHQYLTGDMQSYCYKYWRTLNEGWFSEELFQGGRNFGFNWLLKFFSTLSDGEFQVFLIVSAVFPNGHHLRPKNFERDNIFIDMVKKLYIADTSTNVLPSIHVYNSLAVMIAVWRTKLLKKHRVIKASLMLLGVSIICSTVLLKQHSMLDVLVAFMLGALVYVICYRDEVAIHASIARTKAKIKV